MCQVNNTTYFVCPPSPADKLNASVAYEDILYECSFTGVFTQESLLQMLLDNNLWTMEEENELNSAPTRMDALKVEMYKRFIAFQSRRVEQAKRLLLRLRTRQAELARRRHAYDLYTDTGLAEAFRLQHLISCSTRDVNDNPVDLESQSEAILRRLLDDYLRSRPNEFDLRKLSQYSKWRMIWSSGRQEGRVFGVPSTWLTDEQQGLIAWSKLYDNINEHPEQPIKEVVEDDDLLDGWIILEQKKREKERSEREGDDKARKRGGAQEVFIPAETREDAKRIEQMNEAGAAFTKRQRMAALKSKGVMAEQHMPDSQQKISVQAAQQFRDRMKQARR